MLKICLLMHSFFPQRGLTAPYEVARQLVISGFSVSVIALGRIDEPAFESIDGIEVHRIIKKDSPIVTRIKFFVRSKDLLSKIQPHLVHVYFFFGCFLLPIYSIGRNIKWLLDIRSSFTFSNYPSLVVELINRFIGFHSVTFDEVGVLSQGIHTKIFGTRSKRLTNLTPLGADISRFRSDISRAPDDIPRDFYDKHCVLVYQGSISSRRNVDLMVRAFAIAHAIIPELRLLIVGDGQALNQVRSLTTQLGLCQYVHFTGYVPFDDVFLYLNISDIGLSYIPITDIYKHQPALKTAEYLAAGLPVVATNSDSNHFFMTNEVGVFSDDSPEEYAQAIVRLYNQKEKFPEMSYKAIEIAKQHDWSTIIEEFIIPLYTKTLDTKKFVSI